MNIYRGARRTALGLVAAIAAVGVTTSADAHGLYFGGSPRCYGTYTPGHLTHGNYGSYGTYGCHNIGHYQPTITAYRTSVRPHGCPVTLYDIYGRPYVVWRTKYSTLSSPYLR